MKINFEKFRDLNIALRISNRSNIEAVRKSARLRFQIDWAEEQRKQGLAK